MKKIIPLSLLILLNFALAPAQTSGVKNNPVGKWKFEAPYAPEGYNTGLIEVAFAENKYSAVMSFTGSDYKISGEKVKVVNDTLNFTVLVEGNDVVVNLKMEGAASMTGKAVYVEGEIPLTLKRDTSNQ